MKTLDYYNNNAFNFYKTTLNANMTEIQNEFLSYLSPNSSILDFGCGSGRDIKAFLDKGFNVDGVDGSEPLAKLAQEYTGIPIIISEFRDFYTDKKYDGIWACASLLHFPINEIKQLLKKLISFLKPDGILYFSIREGNFSGIKSGRFFQYLTKEELDKLLFQLPSVKPLKIWITQDKRENKNHNWHNVIIKKINNE